VIKTSSTVELPESSEATESLQFRDKAFLWDFNFAGYRPTQAGEYLWRTYVHFHYHLSITVLYHHSAFELRIELFDH
jgi:hypothetical protein